MKRYYELLDVYRTQNMHSERDFVKVRIEEMERELSGFVGKLASIGRRTPATGSNV